MMNLCGECKEIGRKLKAINNNIKELPKEEIEKIRSIIYFQRRDEEGTNCVFCTERYSDDVMNNVLYS